MLGPTSCESFPFQFIRATLADDPIGKSKLNGIFQYSTIHDIMFITSGARFLPNNLKLYIIGVRVIGNLHNCVIYLQLPESFRAFFSN